MVNPRLLYIALVVTDSRGSIYVNSRLCTDPWGIAHDHVQKFATVVLNS